MRFFEAGLEISKDEAIEILLERDGNRCMFPDCEKPFDNDKHQMTFDHTYPQVRAKEAGWEFESIHGVDNLTLMGRSCNTKKGDLEYLEDGTLPIVEKAKKLPKAKRPEYCRHCRSGREVYPGDNCSICGIGAQPTTAPGVFQKHSTKCDHKYPNHCAHCYAYVPGLRTGVPEYAVK